MKLKNIVLGISFILQPFLANAQDLKGSIISSDNSIVVENVDSDA